MRSLISICTDWNPKALFCWESRGGQELVQKLRQEGYMAEIIGQTNDGNDRLLYSGSGVRYLERPGEDELYKIKML